MHGNSLEAATANTSLAKATLLRVTHKNTWKYPNMDQGMKMSELKAMIISQMNLKQGNG